MEKLRTAMASDFDYLDCAVEIVDRHVAEDGSQAILVAIADALIGIGQELRKMNERQGLQDEPEAEEPVMIRCWNCGKTCIDDGKCCPECGIDLPTF